MPNWCSNSLCLQHEDPNMIARAVKAFDEGRLLEEFIPVPAELSEATSPNREESAKALKEKYGYADWYDFCVNEWGTKWDVGSEGSDADTSPDGKVMSVYFDSAWSPPIAAYEQFEQMGFKVFAKYYESGCCFAGIYDDCGDEYYDLSGLSADEIAEQIPEDLDLEFNISEMMRELEDPEPLTEWYKQGVEDRGLDKDE